MDPTIIKRGWEVTLPAEGEELSRNEVLQKAAQMKEEQKKQDETLADSFPASDPPATNVFD